MPASHPIRYSSRKHPSPQTFVLKFRPDFISNLLGFWDRKPEAETSEMRTVYYYNDFENHTYREVWLNEDRTLKPCSFYLNYYKVVENDLLEAWPAVESALKEHDISCEMDVGKGTIEVKSTKETKPFQKSTHLLKLLATGFPAHRALNILNDKMQSQVIEVRFRKGSVTKGQALKWVNCLRGPEESNIKELCILTECDIFVSDLIRVAAAIGPSHGINLFRRIVMDCVKDRHSPQSHITRLMYNLVGLNKTVEKLENQTGITSIMEAVRFMKTQIIFRELIYTKFTEALHLIEDTDALEIIADKLSSSDSPEVHGDASEALCAIIKFAPPGLSTKISSPSFIRRLFQHALEESRPKSVLVNSLSVCISLLDPRRIVLGAYEHFYGHKITSGSRATANSDAFVGMLERLGDLLKLLDVSLGNNVLLSTYGRLQPPLGEDHLKILEFISVLVTVGSKAVLKELTRLGGVQRIVDLFFKYPFNNFAHHHIENILVSCLESKNARLKRHLLLGCDLLGRILEAEKNLKLAAHSNEATVPAEGRSPPRIGNIGHLTRLSNKIIQLGKKNRKIRVYLQENSEWTDWYANVLSKRNRVEGVWACGGPNSGKRSRTEEIRSSSLPHSIKSSPPSSPLPMSKNDPQPIITISGSNYGWHIKV